MDTEAPGNSSVLVSQSQIRKAARDKALARGLGGFPKPGSRKEVSPLGSPRQGWTLLSVISSLARAGFLRHSKNSRTTHMGWQLDYQLMRDQGRASVAAPQQGCTCGGPTALPHLPHLCPHLFPTTLPSHLHSPNARPTQGGQTLKKYQQTSSNFNS